jgi:hypothetical protein
VKHYEFVPYDTCMKFVNFDYEPLKFMYVDI